MPYNFTNEEYADIIYVYGLCDGNGRQAAEEYHIRFPNRRTPNHQTFSTVYRYAREHGRFPSSKVERNIVQNVEEQENIINIVQEHPEVSTRRISAQLGVPHVRVWRTLNKERLHPYHIQQAQRLEQGDNVNRLEFCQWIIDHRPTTYRTLFTDEAQFTRDGVFNSRNSHNWAENNPHAIREAHSQHKFSVNVWCGMINSNLIGPHIFPARLTTEVYLDFLQNILPGLMQGINIRGQYFQHDGAPPHFGIEVRRHLDNEYPNRWIGRGGPHPWPARSPDFNPVDYFLWGYLKTEVYSVPINSREQLLQRIIRCSDQIRNNPAQIRKSIGNLNKRQQKCMEAGGSHFENLL